jgi:hypothetical protein
MLLRIQLHKGFFLPVPKKLKSITFVDVKLKRKQALLGSNLSGIDLIHRLNVEIKDYL